MSSANRMPRMTEQTQAVLDTLIAQLDDQGQSLYGLQIAQATELSVGTVYPVLRRLLEAGWLTDELEDAAVAESEGRPRRRYYKLTAAGAPRARNALHDIKTRRERARQKLRGAEGIS